MSIRTVCVICILAINAILFVAFFMKNMKWLWWELLPLAVLGFVCVLWDHFKKMRGRME